MIKTILKTIFPRTIRKDIFLIYNKIKNKTWDKLFFPEKFINNTSFQTKEQTNPFLENKVPVAKYSQKIQSKLQIWLNSGWTQDQYLLHYKQAAYIEPRCGWAITANHCLIYPSLGFSKASYVRKPSFLESYFYRKNIVHLPKVISLRDTGEENYFHFYNDVLTKLFFIEDQGFKLNDFSIIVTERLFKKEFFQYFFKNTFLKDLMWHIQDDEWILFDEAIFCKPYTHSKKYLDKVVSLVRPPSSGTESRRIFLTRHKRSLRFVGNLDEIKPVLENYKFEIIDTAHMKVYEQIKLFSECKYLISIHGAGLTNMIFRNQNPLAIIEIVHPFDYIPFHYIMLAHQFGYDYDILLGTEDALQFQGGFRVDPAELQEMIEAMIKGD